MHQGHISDVFQIIVQTFLEELLQWICFNNIFREIVSIVEHFFCKENQSLNLWYPGWILIFLIVLLFWCRWFYWLNTLLMLILVQFWMCLMVREYGGIWRTSPVSEVCFLMANTEFLGLIWLPSVESFIQLFNVLSILKF